MSMNMVTAMSINRKNGALQLNFSMDDYKENKEYKNSILRLGEQLYNNLKGKEIEIAFRYCEWETVRVATDLNIEKFKLAIEGMCISFDSVYN